MIRAAVVLKRTIAVCFVAGGALAWADEVTSTTTVRDLAYGAALYSYFQQDYFNALTELTAALKLERLPHHAERAELLRGGISMSYGLDKEARAVFERMLAEPRDGVDRDRAWFYLAKLAWRRGDSEGTDNALAMLHPQYSGEVADEAHYLRAIQALRAGELSESNGHLLRISAPCPFKPYYFYNLGVSRAAQEDWRAAAGAFEQVVQLACLDPEGKRVSDRARAAAGYSHLAAGEMEASRRVFRAVSLSGPEADRALLGYGWSFANAGNYQKALGAWQELAERDLFTAPARESLLAVPFAYEQLARPATALRHYQHAAGRYAEEGKALAEVMGLLETVDIEVFFGLQELNDLAWLGGRDPEPVAEHGRYLVGLLSTEQVQLALREYRDLQVVRRHLRDAGERLGMLQQVDTDQRAVWKDTVAEGRAQELAERRRGLLEQVQRLRAQLDEAVANNGGRAVAEPAQLALWQRLERAEAAAGRLGEGEKQARLRIVRGLLTWQDNENFPRRRWQLEREMRDIEQLAGESAEAYSNLQQALDVHRRPVYAPRIDSLSRRVEQQLSQVARAIEASERQLRTAALAELEQQHRQLARGESQALLAMARLYDRASPEVPR